MNNTDSVITYILSWDIVQYGGAFKQFPRNKNLTTSMCKLSTTKALGVA